MGGGGGFALLLGCLVGGGVLRWWIGLKLCHLCREREREGGGGKRVGVVEGRERGGESEGREGRREGKWEKKGEWGVERLMERERERERERRCARVNVNALHIPVFSPAYLMHVGPTSFQ